MVGRRDEGSGEAMVDVTYRQSAGERQLVAVMQKLYLCASTEFLMAITDFFLQALSAAPKDRLALKQTAEPQAETKMGKNRRRNGEACQPSSPSLMVVVMVNSQDLLTGSSTETPSQFVLMMNLRHQICDSATGGLVTLEFFTRNMSICFS